MNSNSQQPQQPQQPQRPRQFQPSAAILRTFQFRLFQVFTQISLSALTHGPTTTTTTENNSTRDAKSSIHFDSKFSKSFQPQVRMYIDCIFKMYSKKFKKLKELNKLEKDLFWVIITFFINRKTGARMNIRDIKAQYYRKNSSQQKSHRYKVSNDKRLLKKIMKR